MNAMPTGKVDAANVAYLTDRVLCAEGKPQRHGTQCIQVDKKFEPLPVEDHENLNQRRAEVGLEPIESYLAMVQSTYPMPVRESRGCIVPARDGFPLLYCPALLDAAVEIVGSNAA